MNDPPTARNEQATLWTASAIGGALLLAVAVICQILMNGD